jgi:predicted RNA-binding protein with RPS1 domain
MVGEVYEGKVMRGASFGAFIQLEPSLEGLAHISQLARFRVNKVEDVLAEGMIVPVKILDIDLEKRRISLSVKEVIDLPKLVRDEPAEEDAAKGPAAEALDADAELDTVDTPVAETVAEPEVAVEAPDADAAEADKADEDAGITEDAEAAEEADADEPDESDE